MHVTQITGFSNTHYLKPFVRMSHCWGFFLVFFIFKKVKALAWTKLLANFFPHWSIITKQMTQKEINF